MSRNWIRFLLILIKYLEKKRGLNSKGLECWLEDQLWQPKKKRSRRKKKYCKEKWKPWNKEKEWYGQRHLFLGNKCLYYWASISTNQNQNLALVSHKFSWLHVYVYFCCIDYWEHEWETKGSRNMAHGHSHHKVHKCPSTYGHIRIHTHHTIHYCLRMMQIL